MYIRIKQCFIHKKFHNNKLTQKIGSERKLKTNSNPVLPGRHAQSRASLTANQGVAGSSPGPATYFRGDLS